MGDTISAIVFRPPRPTPIRSDRHFWLKIDDEGNRVPAFFIKKRNARVTLLFSHGNAEDLGMLYHRMKDLARALKVNVMAYEYSGYGLSTGEPSEENCYKCINAAYHFLRHVRNIEPQEIVLYGRSVGSGPTCYLAAKTAEEGNSVAGVILHSPFLSIFRVVVDFGFSMAGDMFKNIHRAPKIRCPVLIIHGTKDDVVPFWHAPGLLKSIQPQFRAKPFYAEGMGHNNIESRKKEEFLARISEFLYRYIVAMNLDQISSPSLLIPPTEIPEHERGDAASSHPHNVINPAWARNWHKVIDEVFQKKKKDEAENKRSKCNGKENESFTPSQLYMPSGIEVEYLDSRRQMNRSTSKPYIESQPLPHAELKRERSNYRIEGTFEEFEILPQPKIKAPNIFTSAKIGSREERFHQAECRWDKQDDERNDVSEERY